MSDENIKTLEQKEVEKEKRLIYQHLTSEITSKNSESLEYEDVASLVNKKHKTKYNVQQIHQEVRKIVNKLFSMMIEEFPDKMFHVVQIIAEEFNVEEEKIIRYLDNTNSTKLKDFSRKHYNTYYWEKKEQDQIAEKLKKKELKNKTKSKPTITPKKVKRGRRKSI